MLKNELFLYREEKSKIYYKILFKNKDPKKAVYELMIRKHKSEL